MSSLFEDDDPEDGTTSGNLPEMTVTELSAAVKRTVEDRFGLVRVRAEIGRLSRPQSGHVYLSLKDDRAVIDGVIWKGKAATLPIRPEEGLEVIVTGKLTTFAGQSKYQIVIDRMEPAGEGALMAMLEARRKALAAEGLFSDERKRPIPMLPEVIGVVTSPSGAVIRDILHRLSERFPRRVLIWPVPVQGDKCAPSVAAAIRGFNALSGDGPIPRPDVLIVARGGGSLEDLWGFNEEIVVRAAADSSIPLISAVGHETDITLIDHAADLRAPTPTAAAEKAVPVRAELLASLEGFSARRLRAMTRMLDRARDRLVQTVRLLPKPAAMLSERRQRLDLAAERLPRALVATIDRRKSALAASRASLRPGALRERVAGSAGNLASHARRLHAALPRTVAARRDMLTPHTRRFLALAPRITGASREKLTAVARTLEALSYLRVLDRGFAVVRDSGGTVLPRAEQVAPGAAISIEFADCKSVPAVAGPAKKAQKPRTSDDSKTQSDLFDLP